MKYEHNKSIAYEFLCTQEHATLVTLNVEGKPDTAVVFFFIDPDFSCYFVTKVHTKKSKNLLENNFGTLFTYDVEKLISAEIKGTVDLTNDIKKNIQTITKFQQLILSKKAEYWVPPIAQIEAGEYIVCKLTPQSLTYKDYSKVTRDTPISFEIAFT